MRHLTGLSEMLGERLGAALAKLREGERSDASQLQAVATTCADASRGDRRTACEFLEGGGIVRAHRDDSPRVRLGDEGCERIDAVTVDHGREVDRCARVESSGGFDE